MEPRWYGVSTGDGNSGVSHMFASYYVRCTPDEAWRLAKEQAKADLKAEYHEEIQVDGDADFGILAWIYDDPSHYEDYIEEMDYSDWESGPAPYICEVFPEEDKDWLEKRRDAGVLFYDSLAAALGEEV